jgi:hypothetical protein
MRIRSTPEASVVDFDLQVIDSGIPGNHLGQRLVVSIDERSHDCAQALFGQAAHRQQPLVQRGELLDEMTAFLTHEQNS